MIVLGAVLAIVGAVISNQLLLKLGVALMLVGVVLALVGYPVY